MNYLHSLIANSNKTLDKHLPIIDRAMQLANEYIPKHLTFRENIDIIFFDDPRGVIPETHAGGYTNDTIRISISLDGQEPVAFGSLFTAIAHECCHATRWQNNSEWADTLLKDMLFEGTATEFEIKAGKDNHQTPDFFEQYVLDNQKNAQRIIDEFRDKLSRKSENHYVNFIGGDGGNRIPRWAGYVAGTYLVEQIIKSTGLSIDKLYDMPYDDLTKLLVQNKII